MSENGKLTIFRKEKCSELFARTFCHSGSIEVECTACGRVHFYDDETYFGDQEELYKQLKKEGEENPEKCIGRDTDMVSWFNFGGKQVVVDCPCNYPRLIEDILWSERGDITSYIKARADEEKKVVDRDAESANAAHSAVHDE